MTKKGSESGSRNRGRNIKGIKRERDPWPGKTISTTTEGRDLPGKFRIAEGSNNRGKGAQKGEKRREENRGGNGTPRREGGDGSYFRNKRRGRKSRERGKKSRGGMKKSVGRGGGLKSPLVMDTASLLKETHANGARPVFLKDLARGKGF